MTEEFPFFARAYRRILDASTSYTRARGGLLQRPQRLHLAEHRLARAAAASDDDDETVRRKLAATATYLDIWLMRRAVNYIRVGYSSVSYAMYLLCTRHPPQAADRAGRHPRTRSSLTDDVTFEGSAAAAGTASPSWGSTSSAGATSTTCLLASPRTSSRCRAARPVRQATSTGRSRTPATSSTSGPTTPSRYRRRIPDTSRSSRMAQPRRRPAPAARRRQPQLPGQALRRQGAALRQAELLRRRSLTGGVPAPAAVHRLHRTGKACHSSHTSSSAKRSRRNATPWSSTWRTRSGRRPSWTPTTVDQGPSESAFGLVPDTAPAGSPHRRDLDKAIGPLFNNQIGWHGDDRTGRAVVPQGWPGTGDAAPVVCGRAVVDR